MQLRFLLGLTLTGVALNLACGESGPSNEEPVARMRSACAALRCEFQDASTDDVSVTGWIWTFGDGASTTDQHPVHLYATPDTYTVNLTVTDREGLESSATKPVVAKAPAVAPLECADATEPGGFVRCNLRLEHEAGFRVVLTENCHAHGNLFRLTLPILDTLTTDGCFEPAGVERTYAGPFPAGTVIDAEIIAPQLPNPPQVEVTDSYPEWTLRYEYGGDSDFNDLVVTITALPTGS